MIDLALIAAMRLYNPTLKPSPLMAPPIESPSIPSPYWVDVPHETIQSRIYRFGGKVVVIYRRYQCKNTIPEVK